MGKKYLELAGFGTFGMALMFFCTSRYGAGISPDSLGYMSAAENLMKGFGFVMSLPRGDIPMTKFPPLFPSLLALAGLCGQSIEDAARWLNVVLFGANITLVGFMVERYTRSARLAMFASFLMLFSVDMLRAHSMALTEPLFIFLTLSALLLSAVYCETGRFLFFAAAVGAAAMAWLTRYVGVALIAAASAGILLCGGETRWRKRVINSVVFAAAASLPMFLWMLRNLYLTGNAADRTIVFHPFPLYKIYQTGLLCAGWLAPVNYGAVAGVFVLTLEAAVLAVLVRLSRKSQAFCGTLPGQQLLRLPVFLAFFIGCYGALLVVSLSFFDAATPLNSRILSPVYAAGLVLAVSMAYRLGYPLKNNKIFRGISAAVGIAIALYYLLSGATWTAKAYANGQGYSSRQWMQSETLQTVRNLPSGISIYTNGSDPIMMFTGRRALSIPHKFNHVNGGANVNYSADIAAMRAALRKKDAVVVYLYNITWRWYLPSEDELKKQLPLRLVARAADGAVYRAGE